MKDYGQILLGVKTGVLQRVKKLNENKLKSNSFSVWLVLFVLLANIQLFANDTVPDSSVYKVYQLDIKEEIGPPVWHLTQKAFEEARAGNFDLVFIHMNTYGGLVDAADSIRTAILNSSIPVYVLIDNNAASAGALISIACDSIYMVSGANIGAATVVNQTGEAMPDKYQSYMRSMMRSTAEATGRDPQIAQAMVDPRIKIPGVIDSGMVITFTTSEAILNDFCQAQVESIEEIMARNGIENFKIEKQIIKSSDKIIRFLINPMVSGILIMLIVGGLYFELQTPGIGFPLGAAIIAALLYFAPFYLEGMLENWEIIIFFVGIIFLAVEIFLVPGFGFFGITGIVLIIASLALAMVDNDGFAFTIPNIEAILEALFIVLGASIMGLILAFYISKKIFATSSNTHLTLSTTQQRNEGFGIDIQAYKNSIGSTGIAYTVMRPSGKVKIDDGLYDAVSMVSFIEKGDKIKVVAYENAQLLVKKI